MITMEYTDRNGYGYWWRLPVSFKEAILRVPVPVRDGCEATVSVYASVPLVGYSPEEAEAIAEGLLEAAKKAREVQQAHDAYWEELQKQKESEA